MNSKTLFVAELEWLYNEIVELECPLAFIHGDVWSGNILYESEKGDDCLIHKCFFNINILYDL